MNVAMKKSELIRAAVDEHLAASANLDGCITLGYIFHVLIPKSGIPLSDLVDSDRMHWNSLEDFARVQAVRFMYAEFLALEAEDEEAALEEQWKALEEQEEGGTHFNDLG